MAELTESRMNIAALKRVDPYVKTLLETAAHVALYTFNANDNEWEKTDIEGALFVYSRTGEPFHNILIMNRLSMKNLVEPVTQGLDLQLQDPFLLYRNTQGSIYGIWFYDKEECVKIASTLTKLVKETVENKSEKKGRKKTEVVGGNVDIFTMLTKAQEEYNSKSPRKGQSDLIGSPPDVGLNNLHFKETDATPQSVMDFFAKASSGSKFIHEKPPAQPPGIFIGPPRTGPPPGLTRMQSVPITIPPSQNDVKPLLQRLMSNPAHSVEHIEKQQRAITPQSELAALMRNKNTGNNNESNKRNSLLGYKVQPESNQDIPRPIGQMSKSHVENGMGFLRISDSSPTTVQTQQFFNSSITQHHSPIVGDGPMEMNAPEHRSLSAPMETPIKPALMPPVMFTSSAAKEECPAVISTTTPGIIVNPTTTSNYHPRPEPLTKNQLLQAVSYLLKNDPDFIHKLHEAYIRSFAELVS